MAFADTTANTGASRGFFGAILDFFVHVAESNSRVRLARELNEMSDEELAERGLKRTDIARHVYGDLYYI
ncbi:MULTISPECIES: DUF1127 domain-containing protein [unclassified Roseivivax]|uniref:DUF1127 domain-containing protein n=1 Tax=Roseivivax sp. GX 12232 TaxID=2900547 RepID=UPI001E4B5300|nr:DUF1127 domain-containing protein [Roseivivax sp. GX 12232]MCE0504441.1 DUF1127 domain-containing protein [Roseivivax sp. GX 12232]